MPDSLLPLPDEPQDLIAFVEARLTEDELWAKAASAGRDPDNGTVEGGIHWTWASGDQWDPVVPDPLEPYMGGYEGQWSQPVVLRSVEEWQLSWGGPTNTLPLKIAESEELRTADGAHIVRHDPARVLRDVAALRSVVEECKDTMEWSKQLRREGRPDDAYARHVGSLLGVLRSFAAVWSEHPDFRSEWSPDAH
jgi:hypothetical protein